MACWSLLQDTQQDLFGLSSQALFYVRTPVVDNFVRSCIAMQKHRAIDGLLQSLLQHTYQTLSGNELFAGAGSAAPHMGCALHAGAQGDRLLQSLLQNSCHTRQAMDGSCGVYQAVHGLAGAQGDGLLQSLLQDTH